MARPFGGVVFLRGVDIAVTPRPHLRLDTDPGRRVFQDCALPEDRPRLRIRPEFGYHVSTVGGRDGKRRLCNSTGRKMQDSTTSARKSARSGVRRRETGSRCVAPLENIEPIEKRLWNAAETLRAYSNYASNEYYSDTLLIFLLKRAMPEMVAGQFQVLPRAARMSSGVKRPREISTEDGTNRAELAVIWPTLHAYDRPDSSPLRTPP